MTQPEAFADPASTDVRSDDETTEPDAELCDLAEYWFFNAVV